MKLVGPVTLNTLITLFLGVVVAVTASSGSQHGAPRSSGRRTGQLNADAYGKVVNFAPPLAAKQDTLLVNHGDARVDSYYWLRDDNRKSPAVLAYLTAENEYAEAAMADTEDLQGQLYQEMKGWIQEADVSVATRQQGYYYYTRSQAGQQYPVHCRRAVPVGAGAPSEYDSMDESQPEEILLDENKRKEAGGFEFYMVGSVQPSPNQQALAWTEDTTGGEKFTLHVKEIASGLRLTEPIPMTSGEIQWASDNQHLLYTVKDELDRPYKVMLHSIGSGEQDTVVYEEKDEAFYVDISRSRSGEMIFVSTQSMVTNETYWLPAHNPKAPLTLVLPRQQAIQYYVHHHPGGSRPEAAVLSEGPQGWFVMVYRGPEHPNSEIRVAPVRAPSEQQVLLPHRADVTIEEVSLGARWLVVTERSRAQVSLVAYALPEDGTMPASQLGQGQLIKYEEAAYSLAGGLFGDFDSAILRMQYTSLTTPRSTYDQNLQTGNRIMRKQTAVLAGFDKDNYVTQRLWAAAADGVAVPISVVFKKGLVKLDGTDPLLMHGYGAYGVNFDAEFDRDALTLLDRGWIVAIAHVRGGGDMGRAWYEDGKYLKKRNTFTDFIACAEHLIKLRYTSPSRLAIEGRSAGGLLMGAVTNMRPDLFNAVIMGVPFVDALTTMLDDTIPLTTNEWEEWGDPRQEQYYWYMKSYSPVDNVAAQNYPHILVTAGLNDPRVGYWEPAKLVAKLRAWKTNDNLLLLKTNMGAGHFSVTGRFARLREQAVEYAFLLKTAGMISAASTP